MVFFLDTSALIKLYHAEQYSDEVRILLRTKNTEALIVSELAKVEFDASIWRKVRSTQRDARDFDEREAFYVIKKFENDWDSFEFLTLNQIRAEDVKRLLNRINSKGGKLRSLDALQLFTATRISVILDGFITFDRDLANAARLEGLPVFDQEFFQENRKD